MKRIRSVHITPSVRLLGARRSLLTLVQNLMGTRIEPLVVVPREGDLTAEFDRLRIPYRIVFLPPWRKAKSWLSMRRQVRMLRDVITEWNADIVHCNEIYPNPHALAAVAGPSVGLELMSRLVQHAPMQPLQVPVVTHMRLSVNDRLIRNYDLESATRIICVSNGAAGDFDGYPWKNERVKVVYNGIDFDPYLKAPVKRNEIRAALDLGADDFVIGQFGLMMPRKRPRFLIDSAVAILREVPNAKFLMIGDASPGQNDYLEGLKKTVRDQGLDSAFRFLPFTNNVADYYGTIDLMMLVSDEEGFGRVILEAAAAGVPSVGSMVGGIPELIVDGETGFLLGESPARAAVDAEFWMETDKFVKIVSDLANDPALKTRLGLAAQHRATSNFSVSNYVSGTVPVFEEAIAEFGERRDGW